MREETPRGLGGLLGAPATAPEIRTERLLLRRWRAADRAPFAALNADPRVMEHFPATLSTDESDAVAARIEAGLDERGYGLWALEIPAVAPFAGFVGLSVPGFEAHFTPCVEIAWRLAAEHWGRGYAPEAARAALAHGFATLGLREIVSFTRPANLRSRRVMEKIGMRHDAADDFDHPDFPEGHRVNVLYRIPRAAARRRADPLMAEETLSVLKALLGRPQPGAAPKLDVAAITGGTRIDEIGLDSLAILDFIYDVEDRFQIQIDIADLVALDKVSDLIDYVEAKRAGVSQLRRIWNRIEAVAARGLLLAVAAAPLPVVLGVAGVAARAAFVLLSRRRRIAVDNIRRAGIRADEAGARALALDSFRAFATMVAETIVARRRLTRDNWAEHVRLHLSAEADELLRKPGQGLIVASAHLGNWEVAARAISMVKPICVAYRPFNNPELDQVAHAAREGEHLRLVSRLEAHPLRFMRALAGGDVVALMIDQHATRGRVAIRFFDRPAWATKSVAMLSLTTRMPLVVAFAVRTGPLRYEIHAAGPLDVARSGDREKDAAVITQALTAEVEKAVRLHPDQYLWAHRRWRSH